MHLGGARQAIHDATALHLRNGSPVQAAIERAAWGVPIDSSPRANNNMVMDLVEAGRILRAVDEQPGPVRDWLLYAYAAEWEMRHRDYLVRALFLEAHQDEADMTKRARLSRLARLAVEDMRMRTLSGGARKVRAVTMAADLGVADNHWRRDGWHRELKAYQWTLDRYDRRGLAAVSEVVDALVGNSYHNSQSEKLRQEPA